MNAVHIHILHEIWKADVTFSFRRDNSAISRQAYVALFKLIFKLRLLSLPKQSII